jgi:hypothetical protein
MSDPSADSVTAVADAFRHRLDHLAAEGRQIRQSLASAPDGPAELAALGMWQRECAATIGQLSGGSKTHWLARAYSEAFLVPLAPAESASVTLIVERILGVLDRAGGSLASAPAVGPPERGDASPGSVPHGRFSFIEDLALRPHLESAYVDGQGALARGEPAVALVTFCSILDAVITYALEQVGRIDQPWPGPIAAWPFAGRIAAAEQAGLISGACARLPAIALQYRSLLDSQGDISSDRAVSSRDATLASQVLHVILRDRAPGR